MGQETAAVEEEYDDDVPPPSSSAGATTLPAVRKELSQHGFCTEIEDVEAVLEFLASRSIA